MPTLNEYAQLSDRVYIRTSANRIPIPSGWTELHYDLKTDALLAIGATDCYLTGKWQ
jgi:hypothetical protein